jgi:DMSO/TMAO reductase YedYZ molybdopterin-dependent catalytic subunit
MKLILFLLLLIFADPIHQLPAQSASRSASAYDVVKEVQIKGLVEKPLSLSVSSLRNKKVVEGKNYQIISAKGEVKGTIASYKGVLLKGLLNEANITMPNPKERGKYYIVVSGTDGYQVLFAWNELYSSPAGEKVYLLFEENGKEIMEDGPFVLICASDTITGPRHVKWVKSIEVAKIN